MHLRSGEKIIRVIRHHWVAISGVVLLSGLVLALLMVTKLYFNFNFFGYYWQVVTFASLLASIGIIYKVYLWRKNGLYITNQRVVNNEQRGFFTKTVTELLYQDIHEIKYHQKGLFASVGNYGTLVIKTFGNDEIVFDNIVNPEVTVEIINKIRTPLLRKN